MEIWIGHKMSWMDGQMEKSYFCIHMYIYIKFLVSFCRRHCSIGFLTICSLLPRCEDRLIASEPLLAEMTSIMNQQKILTKPSTQVVSHSKKRLHNIYVSRWSFCQIWPNSNQQPPLLTCLYNYRDSTRLITQICCTMYHASRSLIRFAPNHLMILFTRYTLTFSIIITTSMLLPQHMQILTLQRMKLCEAEQSCLIGRAFAKTIHHLDTEEYCGCQISTSDSSSTTIFGIVHYSIV